MKRVLISIFISVLSIHGIAQKEQVCNLRVFDNDEVMYLRDINLIDSLNFAIIAPTELGEVENDSTEQLYIGVVAFNQAVYQLPITSDVDSAKAFINLQSNDKDQTAFAYAVSKGNDLFNNTSLPVFDKIFMLNFTDGFDNWSNRIWNDESRFVGQLVYDTAQYDLSKNANLNSYAIAFGDDSAYRNSLQMLVNGNGGYYKAATSNDLQSTFNEIAKSMIASAKNVIMLTNDGYFPEDFPKKFQFVFDAVGGCSDTIYASVTGELSTGYTLVIDRVANQYVSFDAPVYGVTNEATGKISFPLNNMKFIKEGNELQFTYTINLFKLGSGLYEPDVEDSSTSEEISKRIAVVLVLDCSSSMGNAFEPMKAAAVNFIETMESMKPPIKVPTNEELWTKFKIAAGLTDLGTLAEIKATGEGRTCDNKDIPCACRIICDKLDYTEVQVVFDKKEWKWLQTYIASIQPALAETAITQSAWRYAIAAFFLQSQHSAYPTSADFTTAGTPEAWGSAYVAAQK